MKVLIIPSEHFITESEPLGGIFQLHQAIALKNAGFEVEVLSLGFISTRYLFKKYNYRHKEEINGIKIFRKYKKLFFPFRYLGYDYLSTHLIKMTCNYFEEYTNEYGKPDIIHAHNFLFAGVIAEYIKSKYGIKFIITEHSSLFLRQQLSYKEIQAVKSVAQSSDLVTAVSKSFINTLKKLIDNKIELLPNIVDDLFLKAEINLKRKPIFTFIHIGSLDYNKNQELLIRSFARLVRDELDVELIIAGDGAMKNRLKKITADLNLDKYIKFLGRISQSEIQRIMLDADCFVLSSNIETFGVVLIEALACGLPLIATKSGGPEDIINDSNGILIEIGNQNALEDAMLHIYQNSDKFKKESLREDARMRFGSDAFIKNVSSYYKQALKK